jgi:hypothetical protein
MTTSELEAALLNNEYLKERTTKLNNWDYEYLHQNDENGVDAFVSFDLKEFGGLEEHEEFEQVLENILVEYHGIYLIFKDNQMYVSSCDDNFITFNSDEIILSDNTSAKIIDDFHAWLLLEEKCLETGIFGGIYKLGYYGDCEEYKFDKNYGETFSDDEKVRLCEVRKILSMYKMMKDLDNHTAYHYDLPDFAEEQLPNKEIMELTGGNGLEIIELAEVSDGGCWVVFEADSSEMDSLETLIDSMKKLGFNPVGGNKRYPDIYNFSFWIKFKANSKRFILDTFEQDGLIKMMA